MGPIGVPEMIILFVIVLIIFGPKSLPKIGQAMGRGIREFKDAARGLTDLDDEPAPRRSTSTPQQVSQAQPTATQTSTTTETINSTENQG